MRGSRQPPTWGRNSPRHFSLHAVKATLTNAPCALFSVWTAFDMLHFHSCLESKFDAAEKMSFSYKEVFRRGSGVCFPASLDGLQGGLTPPQGSIVRKAHYGRGVFQERSGFSIFSILAGFEHPNVVDLYSRMLKC